MSFLYKIPTKSKEIWDLKYSTFDDRYGPEKALQSWDYFSDRLY